MPLDLEERLAAAFRRADRKTQKERQKMNHLDLESVMRLNAKDLAKKQREMLLQFARERLDSVYTALETGGDLKGLVFFSPGGDDMGRDNACINFDWGSGEEKDVCDLAEKLKELK